MGYWKDQVPGSEFIIPFKLGDESVFPIENNEYRFDKDLFAKIKEQGYPLHKTRKIVHFQTLEDPTQAPTADLAKEIAQMALEGTNADLEFINSGHLCLLPTIPMSTRSVVPYSKEVKILTEWSRRKPEEKPDEAKECEKLYQGILHALDKYF